MTTNRELRARRDAAIPRAIAHSTSVHVARAEGAEVWDVEGRRFLDFAAGIGVLNVGHRHPRVMAAVERQLQQYTHTSFHVMPYEPYIELAEKLNALAPGRAPKKTVLMTTGAEAVENAVKIARAHTGRPGLVAFTGGFHGRTLLALALTGKVVPYKAGFGPFPAEVHHVPYPMEYRGISTEHSLAALDGVFRGDIDPGRVAAIVIEPVVGEGGFYPAPPEFLHALRARCDEHGILLVADEIQTGFGRTGRMFAIEHSGVVPDLMTVAKSLGGGLPLSAVIGRADVMDAPGPGGLGSTYAGNPLACAAGLAVLDVIEEESLLERARAMGDRITSRLRGLAEDAELDCIGDVRGLGAMCAVELVADRESRRPADDLANAVRLRCLDNGLVILRCGLHGNVLRLLVPLNAAEEVVEEGLAVLEASLRETVRAARPAGQPR